MGPQWVDENNVPFGQIIGPEWCAPGATSVEVGGGVPAPTSGHPHTTADDPAGRAQCENPEDEDAAPDRRRDRPSVQGDAAPKRMREVGEDGRERPTGMDWSSLEWSPVAAGLVTRLLSPGDPEDCSDAARAAESKEMGNVPAKGAFSPEQVCYWDEVRRKDPEAMVGKGKMILGGKEE